VTIRLSNLEPVSHLGLTEVEKLLKQEVPPQAIRKHSIFWFPRPEPGSMTILYSSSMFFLTVFKIPQGECANLLYNHIQSSLSFQLTYVQTHFSDELLSGIWFQMLNGTTFSEQYALFLQEYVCI
jgi:hypothetical protein